MFISDLQIGDQVEGFYILQNATAKTTMSGKPFLSMVLGDASGSIDAQIWDYPGPVTPKDTGSVIKVRGVVSDYKGAQQITVDRLRLASADDQYSVADLVVTAPIDVDDTWQEILDIVASIEDADYAAVCNAMLDKYSEQFRTIPAAKSVHHSFLHGLLMHTANMLRAAEIMASIYPEVIDRSLLLAGTLLHDFAKSEEFTFSPLGLVTDYSVKGQLIGHLVLGAQEIASISSELGIPAEKSVLLQHMILSHHGEPEYGAAVKPLCAESELLSYIDMMDSRMEIYREAMAEVPVGEFSKRLFALDKRIFHHA